MANHREGNVIFVDTDAAFTDVRSICGVKYIGNTNGTATIKGSGASGGDVVWQEAGTANIYDQVELRDSEGVYVAVTNGAKVYLYLK
jgi:hypothetical protein